MQEREEIKLGFTYEFVVHAIISIIIGGVCSLVNGIVAILLIAVGITLFFIRTGINIDKAKGRVRKYYAVFSMRVGYCIYINQVKIIELKRKNESEGLQHRAGQNTIENKTYDIILIDSTGFSIELSEFKIYTTATNVLNLIADTFSLKSKNKVEEMRSAALLRLKQKKARR